MVQLPLVVEKKKKTYGATTNSIWCNYLNIGRTTYGATTISGWKKKTYGATTHSIWCNYSNIGRTRMVQLPILFGATIKLIM